MEYSFQALSTLALKRGYRPRLDNEKVPDGVRCVSADCHDDCEREPVIYVHTENKSTDLAICGYAADELNLNTGIPPRK